MTRPASFPFIPQQSVADCGPTCLAMILRYYGREESIERLRQLTQSKASGTTLLGLRKGATCLGMDALSGQMTWDNLVQHSFLPALVLWNQNHYVVVYGIKKDKKGGYTVTVADPAQGLLTYTKEEFCLHWAGASDREIGAVLLVEPSASFHRHPSAAKRTKTPYAYLRRFFGSSWSIFLAVLFLLAVVGHFYFYVPYRMARYLTIYLPDMTVGDTYLMGAILVVSLFCLGLVDWMLEIWGWLLSARFNKTKFSDFMLKLLLLPLSYFDQRNAADLVQRCKSHSKVEEFMSTQFVGTLVMLVPILLFGGILLYYNPILFFIYWCGLLVFVFWVDSSYKKKRGLLRRLAVQEQLETEIISEMLLGVQEIKLQGCELRKRRALQKVHEQTARRKFSVYQQEKKIKRGALFILLTTYILLLVAFIVIPTTSYFFRLVMLLQFFGLLYLPLRRLMRFLNFWQELRWSLRGIEEVYQQPDESADHRTVSYLEESDLSIRLENVCFAYPSCADKKVLEGVNLVVANQALTVLQGADGVGKQSLIRLILGLFEPTQGTIKIGTTPLSEIQLMWWRSQCGTILSDSYIFSDTILGNITLSRAYVEWDRLKKIVDWVQLTDTIAHLPFQYTTRIGGQHQDLTHALRERILWARLLYKDPSHLFLDERSLPQGLALFGPYQEEFVAWLRTKTVLWVSHQPEVTALASRVIQLT